MSPSMLNSGSSELNQILHKINEEGGFSISILTDSQGLAIASASKDEADPDLFSAVVALIQKSIVQAGQRIGLSQTEEFSIYTQMGQRLICRFFVTNNYPLILAIVTAEKNQKYRRLTNQAIHQIDQIWSKYWE